MKQWQGIWFPDAEEHLIQWMKKVDYKIKGRPTYQYAKYQTARDLCKQRRRVIDVGANIGLWAMNMQDDFASVECFEPVKEYADIVLCNAPKVFLHRVALGAEEGRVRMVKDTVNSCGDTRPWVEGDTPDKVVEQMAPMTMLDTYEFNDVDLIKIDCEGYELHVLRGALQTIMRNKPVIIVEQKPGHGKTFGYADDAAANYLIALGMRQHTIISGDYVMVW